MNLSLSKTCAVILAAGNSERMQSGKPKIFSQVLFKPLIGWVLQNCKQANIGSTCIVCSEEGQKPLAEHFGDEVKYYLQKQRLGTAHAVAQATEFLKFSHSEDVLILLGDAPFVDSETIKESYLAHKTQKNTATVIAAALNNPFGYGRIDEIDGKVAIIEERDATDAQRAIKKVNSGAMWFNIEALLDGLSRINNKNASGEYYITSVVNILPNTGCYLAKDNRITLGVNTNQQLLELNEVARDQVISNMVQSGVEFVSKDGVVIGPDVVIEKGTTIFPNVTIKGHCKIGSGCVITSGSFIEDSTIGPGCEIKSSYIAGSVIKSKVRIGPFANLRAGNVVGDEAKLGDFVELKNSKIGQKTSVAHLTYIGDSDIGAGVNFGCGCTTANYDGKAKHKTVVGDGAFIGCNTSLIAPVSVGKNAFIAAGSTITDNLGDSDFAISRCRQTTKPGYMKSRKKKQG